MWDWLRWHLEGNTLAVALSILIAGVLGYVLLFGTPFRTDVPNGFGPEWECASQIQGDPTCIKKVKR
ncbi:hypothetical protein SSBR45R_66570 [Bradyrhizobium sp. SSBR45R]|nr:hypothetical protein SSBR45R_66570 [Bradyrhizobium sp. SSBR45R]